MTRKLYHLLTAVLGMLVGVGLVSCMLQSSDAGTGKLILAFWSVVPPIWLYFEYYFLTKNLTPDNLEYKGLKDNQVAAFRLWAGFALALAVLLVKS